MSTWPYDGDWGELRVDKLPEVLAALCVAVNERERANTLVDFDPETHYTHWRLGDGSVGAMPTAKDFAGMFLLSGTKPISTSLLQNLTSLEYKVSAFTGGYVDAPLSDTLVDYSTVTDKWGEFGSTTPESWRDHRIWCRCRDALKLMRYTKGITFYGEAVNAPASFGTLGRFRNLESDPIAEGEFPSFPPPVLWDLYQAGLESPFGDHAWYCFKNGFSVQKSGANTGVVGRNGGFYNYNHPRYFGICGISAVEGRTATIEYAWDTISNGGTLLQATSEIIKSAQDANAMSVLVSDGHSYSAGGTNGTTVENVDYTDWVIDGNKILTMDVDSWDTESNPFFGEAGSGYELTGGGVGSISISFGQIMTMWFDQQPVVTDLQ